MASAKQYTHKIGDPLDTQVPCLRVAARSDGDWYMTGGTEKTIGWFNPSWTKWEYAIGNWTYNTSGAVGSCSQYGVAWIPLSGIYIVNMNIGFDAGTTSARSLIDIHKVSAAGAVMGSYARVSTDSPDSGGWTSLNATSISYYQKGEGIWTNWYCSNNTSLYFYEDHCNLTVHYLSALPTESYTMSTY